MTDNNELRPGEQTPEELRDLILFALDTRRG